MSLVNCYCSKYIYINDFFRECEYIVKVELMKNAIRERIIILLHSIDGDF